MTDYEEVTQVNDTDYEHKGKKPQQQSKNKKQDSVALSMSPHTQLMQYVLSTAISTTSCNVSIHESPRKSYQGESTTESTRL